jgi:integral membrane protein (TIGR01906 family)
MNPPSALTRQIISWLISLAIPFLLIMTAIRVLLSPPFLELEYRMPNFPPDSYGFSMTDRLHWARYAIDYLVNNAGINYLSDLRFEDGSPLYKESELSHMADVKNLVQEMLKGWIIGLAILLLLGIWAWRSFWLNDYRTGLSRGGWFTIGLIVAVLIAVVVNFNTLFTDFHRLFFSGNSWIFLYSDTLIRLFPIRFWQDCFIDMGILSMAGGIFLGIVVKPKIKK